MPKTIGEIKNKELSARMSKGGFYLQYDDRTYSCKDLTQLMNMTTEKFTEIYRK